MIHTNAWFLITYWCFTFKNLILVVKEVCSFILINNYGNSTLILFYRQDPAVRGKASGQSKFGGGANYTTVSKIFPLNFSLVFPFTLKNYPCARRIRTLSFPKSNINKIRRYLMLCRVCVYVLPCFIVANKWTILSYLHIYFSCLFCPLPR